MHFKDLFTIFNGSGTVITVPFFQRGYVWDEDNWRMFLDGIKDLNNTDSKYFMGSIIIKQDKTSVNDRVRDKRILIDGQQRITTVIIFYYTLCKIFDAIDIFKDSNFFLKKPLSGITLEHNRNDRDAFNDIINGEVAIDTMDEKYKNHPIYKCYKYFLEQLSINKEEFIFLDPNNNYVIQLIEFAFIELQEKDNEQKIFDVLNSGGVPLTTADLLKNWLFDKNENQYKDTWQKTFEQDNERISYWSKNLMTGRIKKHTIDIFLQSYLAIITKESDFTKFENVFKEYKKFIGDDKNNHLYDIMKYANKFRENINIYIESETIDKNNYLDRLLLFIFYSGSTTVIPYLLYILIENEKEVNLICKLLEQYLIRRLICKRGTKGYNKVFLSFINNECITFEKLSKKIFEYKEETSDMPNIEEVKNEIKTRKFNNREAKIILYLLELSLSDDNNTNAAKPLPMDLEHIIPQKWQIHWSNIVSIENENDIYKIGNMTLVSSKLNQEISNNQWSVKRDGKDKKSGLKANASNWKTLDRDKYLGEAVFNIKSIESRCEELASHIGKIWG